MSEASALRPVGGRASLARFVATPSGQATARVVVLGALLAVWQFAPNPALRFWVSGPVDIVVRLWSWILDGSLWENLEATLAAMALGYMIGTGFGVALGLVFGFLSRLHRVLSPYISALYALPKIALAPLFVIVLGIGIESKIALVAITVFFLVLTSTLDGVRNVDRDLVHALTLMGATRGEVIRKALVPAALPWIFTGMRIAVRYAFSNTLLAELIASNRGIGFLIEYYSGTFDAAGAYAAILVLVMCSVGLTEVLSRIETRMGRR
jgi:NitT/TauT family transport system permease protein